MIEEQKTLAKPSEELDTIRVGANLPPQMKESIIQFLKDNKDVFA